MQALASPGKCRSHLRALQQLWRATCQLQEHAASCRSFATSAAGMQQDGGNSNGGSSKETRRIYVKRVGTAPHAEALMLGLLNHFKRLYPSVGFFKPVGTDMLDGVPRNVHLMHSAFEMQDQMESMFAIDERSAYQMLAEEQHSELVDLCYSKLHEYQRDKDLVVINGWRYGGIGINAELANHLDAPVLLTMDLQEDETQQAAFERAMAVIQEYRSNDSQVLGVALGSVPQHKFDGVHAFMKQQLADRSVPYLGTFPVLRELSTVSLDQIYRAVSGKLLFTDLDQVQLGDPVNDVYVVTPNVGVMLQRLLKSDRPLLVTTPDRIDTLTTAAAAHSSGMVPLSGVLITDHDGNPSPYRKALQQIFEGLERNDKSRAGSVTQYRLPLIMTSQPTVQALKTISRIDPALLPTSHAKIEAALSAFDEYADPEPLVESFAGIEHKLTPSKFLHWMRQAARDNRQRIVLPEATDHRVIMAAAQAQRKGFAQVVLLGREDQIMQEAAKLGTSLDGVQIIDPDADARTDSYIEELVEARKRKGLSRDAAADLLHDGNYFGTMMVRCGDADGMVSGAAHTTAATVRPGMQVLKDRDMPLVSSVFFMCLPDKVLIYGDCAINVAPDAQQLAHIAAASADTAAAFGIEPRVAMLSYSTLGSGAGPQVEVVTRAVELVRAMRPGLKLTGPIQYDAATNERVAAVKVKDDKDGVAGRANVLVFPDLNTGNNTYKAVQQSTGALAMGPLLQGLAGAVNDLSRGCTVADIVDTICATSLQAQFAERKNTLQAGG